MMIYAFRKQPDIVKGSQQQQVALPGILPTEVAFTLRRAEPIVVAPAPIEAGGNQYGTCPAAGNRLFA